MDKLRNEAEKIAVKVYDMAKGGREGWDETVVRKATIEWARDAILALLPKDKPPLLSDVVLDERAKNIVGAPWGSVRENVEWVAQAQWDIWNKWYEGG